MSLHPPDTQSVGLSFLKIHLQVWNIEHYDTDQWLGSGTSPQIYPSI